MKQKIIVIVGPTAVGKTALAVDLAQKFNGAVVSGDSMQIYRQLDIGTAKVTPEEAQGIPHYLIDEKDFWENYSAFDFKLAAQKALTEIHSEGKLGIVCGGTGLYIQALLEDFSLGGSEIATEEAAQFAHFTDEELLAAVEKKEPALAASTHANNRRRLMRALLRGENQQGIEQYEALIIGLNTTREILHQRINQRVDLMMQQGLLKEAQLLYDFQKEHPQEKCTALQGIGYKEFFPYFAGEISLASPVELVKRNSRRYAKRQITWFKNRMEVPFYNLVEEPATVTTIETIVKQWLKEEIDD